MNIVKANKPYKQPDGMAAILNQDTYKVGTLLTIGPVSQRNKLVDEWCGVELPDEESGGSASWMENESDGSARYCIHLPHWEWDIEHIGILSHESLHIAIYMLDHSGIPIEPGATNEALTYLQEEILTSALTVLEDFYPKDQEKT